MQIKSKVNNAIGTFFQLDEEMQEKATPEPLTKARTKLLTEQAERLRPGAIHGAVLDEVEGLR
jgi:hypothetical protein